MAKARAKVGAKAGAKQAQGPPRGRPRPDAHDPPLPWNTPELDRLLALDRAGKLPHALLIGGPAGVGKRSLADSLVRGLLCRSEAGKPCGVCHDCRLSLAGNHPDAPVLTFELNKVTGKLKTSIGVDQVRALIETLALSPSRAGRQVVAVWPAEAMTAAAANALLKTLEEPAGAVNFVLVSDHPSRLLATVRSRSQIVRRGVPAPAQALAWLEARHAGSALESALRLAGGAPLEAARILERSGAVSCDRILEDLAGLRAGSTDPVSVGARWKEVGAEWTLRSLASLVGDMLRLALGANAESVTNAGHHAALQSCAAGLDSGRLVAMARAIDECARARASRAGFNEPLMLEALAVDVHRCLVA